MQHSVRDSQGYAYNETKDYHFEKDSECSIVCARDSQGYTKTENPYFYKGFGRQHTPMAPLLSSMFKALDPQG